MVVMTMGDAGTVDITGDYTTAGWEASLTREKGKSFIYGSTLYFPIVDLEGDAETTDYKIIALSDISWVDWAMYKAQATLIPYFNHNGE